MKHKDIFLFGREVEDFTFLNKDSIFTITTAALQEIDTQLQNEKQRKENLKTRLKKLEEMF
jgi:predicted ATP-dependent protease